MMDTIVEEKSITFKELEKKIFKYVCDIGIEITQKLLEKTKTRRYTSQETKVNTGIKDSVLLQ